MLLVVQLKRKKDHEAPPEDCNSGSPPFPVCTAFDNFASEELCPAMPQNSCAHGTKLCLRLPIHIIISPWPCRGHSRRLPTPQTNHKFGNWLLPMKAGGDATAGPHQTSLGHSAASDTVTWLCWQPATFKPSCCLSFLCDQTGAFKIRFLIHRRHGLWSSCM